MMTRLLGPLLVTLCACGEPPGDLCTLANPDLQDPVTRLHLLREAATDRHHLSFSRR